MSGPAAGGGAGRGIHTAARRPRQTARTPVTRGDEFETLLEAGWTDAWRVLHPYGRAYTWVSNRGEGFCVDHALLSPSLAPCLHSATISEAERVLRITDHAAVVVDLELA